jgi:hypothetical protein
MVNTVQTCNRIILQDNVSYNIWRILYGAELGRLHTAQTGYHTGLSKGYSGLLKIGFYGELWKEVSEEEGPV